MTNSITGLGEAGTPVGGIVTVQGDPAGTPIPVDVGGAPIIVNADIATATAAAPTYVEGADVTLSTDLAGNLRSRGAKSNNAAAPTSDNLGVLPGVANAATPTIVEGRQALMSFDLGGRARIKFQTTTGAQTSVAAAAVSTLILAASTARLGAALYNDSSIVCNVILSAAAASTTSFTKLLAAGEYWEIPFGYTGQINAIWGSATGSMRITEFT